ncbi:MAG: hypothetical protein E6R03_16000 [Hyphomicrobiaceae bacterium]|nr:MAG: hypothetical protein E6R03_16000 [Hyphomicrobiaceae bacterium]
MKTKLDLYLAVQRLSESTLAKSHVDAEKELVALLKPLNLVDHDQTRFSQQFFSRRHTMLELKNQPLETAAPAGKQ